MNYILNIETATKNCSVAVAMDGELLFCKEIAEEGYSHAENLHVFIEEALKVAKISYKDLAAIAISQGPGSYTGLRIGVSAAKGLCFALDIPLISVNTLKSLAMQAKVPNGFIIPMIDARRMEVYSAIFTNNYKEAREIKAEIIDKESFGNISEPIYFIGDCAAKCKPLLDRDNFKFLDNIIYPSAKEMCILSHEKYKNQDFESLAYFEPFYLKEFLSSF